MAFQKATVLDLAEVYQGIKKAPLTRAAYRETLVAVMAGPSWCVRDKTGKALAIGGVFHFDDRPGHAWFLIKPNLGSAVLPVVLVARKVLRLAIEREVFGIECQVRKGNRKGARMVELLGFCNSGETGFDAYGEIIPDLEIWRFQNVKGSRQNFWRWIKKAIARIAASSGCTSYRNREPARKT